MTGIAKVVLKNIRSHLDTVIEFDPHFNVVAGESDRGKSTVFWAINCVLFNPRGWVPRPWKRLKPKGESRIELHFFDGTVVARVWNKGKNTYELNGESLSGLHGTVPDQVKAALNMTDANVQAQKDMFFLLNETSGKVAREINRVTNLDVMDKALAMATARVKETKHEISELEKLAVDWKEEIELKKPILEVEAALNVLSERDAAFAVKRTKIAAIKTIVDNYKKLQAELATLPSDDCINDVAQLMQDYTRLQDLEHELKSLSKSMDRVQDLQRELKDSEGLDRAAEILQSFSHINKQLQNKASFVIKVNKLCAQYDKAERAVSLAISDECVTDLDYLHATAFTLQTQRKKTSAVNNLLSEIDNIETNISHLTDGIIIDDAQLDELRGGMTVCPTCLTYLNA